MTCGAMRFGVAAAASARASAARSRGVVASPRARGRNSPSSSSSTAAARPSLHRALRRPSRSRAVAEPPPSGSTWEEDADEDADADDEVIPLANPDAPFEYDPDRAYHRYRDLEPLRANLAGLVYGPAINEEGPSDQPPNRAPLPSPMTYRVTLPPDYDATRETPYDMIVVVPSGPGYGANAGDGVGGGAAIQNSAWWTSGRSFIVCELCVNRATWLADTTSSNHESFLMEMILPRVCAEHDVGKISLLGHGAGGFAALHTLMRHAHVFHKVAAFDVPVLGDFNGRHTPWGGEKWDEDKPPWSSFPETFVVNESFAPYNPGVLASCAHIAAALGADSDSEISENSEGSPRIALWTGIRTRWEMEQLREQFEEYSIPAKWSDAHANEVSSWSNGEWLIEALEFLSE